MVAIPCKIRVRDSTVQRISSGPCYYDSLPRREKHCLILESGFLKMTTDLLIDNSKQINDDENYKLVNK
jgi:hypothetical protein